MSTGPDITEMRQECRDEFTHLLRTIYPDPEDPVRERTEPMLDRWWPGTTERQSNA